MAVYRANSGIPPLKSADVQSLAPQPPTANAAGTSDTKQRCKRRRVCGPNHEVAHGRQKRTKRTNGTQAPTTPLQLKAFLEPFKVLALLQAFTQRTTHGDNRQSGKNAAKALSELHGIPCKYEPRRTAYSTRGMLVFTPQSRAIADNTHGTRFKSPRGWKYQLACGSHAASDEGQKPTGRRKSRTESPLQVRYITALDESRKVHHYRLASQPRITAYINLSAQQSAASGRLGKRKPLLEPRASPIPIPIPIPRENLTAPPLAMASSTQLRLEVPPIDMDQALPEAPLATPPPRDPRCSRCSRCQCRQRRQRRQLPHPMAIDSGSPPPREVPTLTWQPKRMWPQRDDSPSPVATEEQPTQHSPSALLTATADFSITPAFPLAATPAQTFNDTEPTTPSPTAQQREREAAASLTTPGWDLPWMQPLPAPAGPASLASLPASPSAALPPELNPGHHVGHPQTHRPSFPPPPFWWG